MITKGSILLNAGAKYNSQTQYLVGPVPLYLELGGGIELGLLGEISRYIPESGDLKLNTELKIVPSFELGGGAGVVGVLTVGATGKVELEFLMRFTDDYGKTSLTGSMDLKATALFFEAKREVLKGTWTIAEGYGNVDETAGPMSTPNNLKTLNLYDAKQYSLMSRDYAQNPSVWQDVEQSKKMFATDYTNKELRILQTNIFPNAQPQLAAVGDKQVMVWIADNTSRTSANRTMLVYSVYDKTTDSWSTPEAVNDDETADFYPQIASDGDNIYTVWQNSNTIFNDTVTMAEAAMSGEIDVARFNTTSNTFNTPTVLTQNNTLDTQPQIAVSGDKAFVIWTNNDQNDLFGTTGQNTIGYSEFNGTWSSPQVLVSNQKAVASLSVGYINNEFTTAFVVDADNDLSTIDDRDIYLAKSNQSVTRLTDNQTLDSNPIFASMNGTKALYWYNNGNIIYLNASDIAGSSSKVFTQNKQGFRDEFKIVNNLAGKTAAIWTETDKDIVEIHSAIYDSVKGEWSDNIEISNAGSKVQFPNGVFDQDGNFNIAFNRLTTLADSTEQSDLCIFKIIPSYNLEVNNVSIEDAYVTPGNQSPIEIDVTNKGELAVEQVKIEVYDGTTLNSSIVKTENIKPGESKTITSLLNVPQIITKIKYTVKVTPVSGDEYDLSDNSKDLTIGYTDLTLTLENYDVGGINIVTAQLSNNSYVPTDATLTVTENLDGKALFTKKITDIVHGENSVHIFEIDPKNLDFIDDIKQLYFKVQSDADELRTGDNSDFIILDKPVKVELNKPSTTLIVGKTEQLIATITPADAIDKSVTWSVSSQSGGNIVTVSDTGWVMAVGIGTAMIRATSNADPTMYAECNATVTANVEFSATPIIQIGINPNYGDSAGIFVGLKDIRDTQDNLVPEAMIAGYQIEICYDHNQAKIFDVVDEVHSGQLTLNNGTNADKISVVDEFDQGTSNNAKLFFVPLAIIGDSTKSTDVVIKFSSISETNGNQISISDVTLTFQRGKIVNESSQNSPSIVDATAGLQYLAKLVDDGLELGKVNAINMASIIPPAAEATGIKPSVKDVIALMQKLVGLRDDTFQLVSGY